MGVPAFFRWLSKKYPSIVVNANEGETHGRLADGTPIPVDISGPNLNNIEFDNLYLDMNGIIHPCTHPENKAAPTNEAEMFVAIFEYMDRLMNICRPRRLLYMAIDGVAPRAKMNQQRSRRFRAAQETREKIENLAKYREEVLARGSYLPPEKPASAHFDSNCITPGTPFMARLADALRFYVHERLHSNPGWANLQVVLSDSNVPGEGEHKIMDFIRRQRNMPDHDPNTFHCLCGADADLIMLGLATHEPNFTIIREEFKPGQTRPCDLCAEMGHEAKDCVGFKDPVDANQATEISSSSVFADDTPSGSETDFIFIRIDILREYLEKELQMDNLPFTYDLERAIDDWVLMCFFVGNDFLPHLPSLEIRENAIDRLIRIYKSSVYHSGGWLSSSGQVDLGRVQYIMQQLGEAEDDIFQRRRQTEENFRRRERQQRGPKRQRVNQSPRYAPKDGFSAPMQLSHYTAPKSAESYLPTDNQSAAMALRQMLRESRMGDSSKSSPTSSNQPSTSGNPKRSSAEANLPSLEDELEELDEFDKADASDSVKLWEEGWRERYYSSKFSVNIRENPDFPNQVAYHYVCGLAWVLAYYYQGCVSWKWYFPFHYAPFSSDFRNVAKMQLPFRNYRNSSDPRVQAEELDDQPFDPLTQLMAVFPADSRQHVPAAWQDLMFNPKSNIIDLYPTKFKVDLNGKRFLWQGVALLPFVDERRLKAAVKARYHLLTPEEVKRNERGSDSYFVRLSHPLSKVLTASPPGPEGDQSKDSKGNKSKLPTVSSGPVNGNQVLDPTLTQGITGRFAQLSGVEADKWSHNSLVKSPLPKDVKDYQDIVSCQVVQVKYWDPYYMPGHIFPARLLPSVVMPERTLKPSEWARIGGGREWRPRLGFGDADSHYRGRGGGYTPVVAQRMVQRNAQQFHSQGYNDYNQQTYEYSSQSYDYPGQGYSNNYSQHRDNYNNYAAPYPPRGGGYRQQRPPNNNNYRQQSPHYNNYGPSYNRYPGGPRW